jgi:hypothetical protein
MQQTTAAEVRLDEGKSRREFFSDQRDPELARWAGDGFKEGALLDWRSIGVAGLGPAVQSSIRAESRTLGLTTCPNQQRRACARIEATNWA